MIDPALKRIHYFVQFDAQMLSRIRRSPLTKTTYVWLAIYKY